MQWRWHICHPIGSLTCRDSKAWLFVKNGIKMPNICSKIKLPPGTIKFSIDLFKHRPRRNCTKYSPKSRRATPCKIVISFRLVFYPILAPNSPQSQSVKCVAVCYLGPNIHIHIRNTNTEQSGVVMLYLASHPLPPMFFHCCEVGFQWPPKPRKDFPRWGARSYVVPPINSRDSCIATAISSCRRRNIRGMRNNAESGKSAAPSSLPLSDFWTLMDFPGRKNLLRLWLHT